MTETVLEYEAIFNHRGDAYAAAMDEYPSARAIEFENLFRHVDLRRARAVADVPSGGGYLAAYLPATVILDAYDPAPAFRDQGDGIYAVDLGNPKLARRDYDLIVSLASLHHIADKTIFFGALADHVKPGGTIILADITRSSRVAGFLDGFIGLHNGTGHDGLYLNPDDPFDFGRRHERVTGARVETLPCPWRFHDRAAMVHFCTLLFGAATVDPREAGTEIARRIGIREQDDSVEMQWELTYITARLA